MVKLGGLMDLAQTIITIASVITALGVIFGVVFINGISKTRNKMIQ